jgi:hypothetical protein
MAATTLIADHVRPTNNRGDLRPDQLLVGPARSENLTQENGPFRHSRWSGNLNASAEGHWGMETSPCRGIMPCANAGSPLKK